MLYGLGAYEREAIHMMPDTVKMIVLEELRDPSTRAEMVEVLRSQDPVGAVRRGISMAVSDGLREGQVEAQTGMAIYDDGMGGLFKKIKKAVKKTVKKVVAPIKKIHAKITPKFAENLRKKVSGSMKDIHEKHKDLAKKIRRQGKRVFVKYGHVILPVAGIILAPFTGGLSIAAAGVAGAGLDVYKKKKAYDEAVRQGKKDTAVLAAEVAAEEAAVNAEADAIYNAYPIPFQSIGLSPDKWAALSVERKVEIINALSKGNLPAGYSYVSEAEAVAAGVAPAPQEPAKPAPYDPVPAYQPPPPQVYAPPPPPVYVQAPPPTVVYAPAAEKSESAVAVQEAPEPQKKGGIGWGLLAIPAAVVAAVVASKS